MPPNSSTSPSVAAYPALHSNRGPDESLLDGDDVLCTHLSWRFVALAKFQSTRRDQPLALTFSAGMREPDGHNGALFDALFNEYSCSSFHGPR